MELPADRRALLVAAVVFLVIPLIFPSSSWPSILLLTVVAGFFAFLYHPFFSSSSSSSSSSDGAVKREIGVSGPTLYTLGSGSSPRTMQLSDFQNGQKLKRTFKHLSLRAGGSLVDKVRRAALLGSKNGNNGSGTKAMVALEDFFIRYHRALVSSSPELAKRTLETLRDTRVVALNAIEDLAFTVPIALSAPIRRASEAVRSETLECMSLLALKHAPALSPGMRASMNQSSPRPSDPMGVVGDTHHLY